MNLSNGEFRSLVAKAFRGAGYSWGLTEEAAFAAGRLAEHGLPVAEMVVRLLTRVDGLEAKELMPDIDWTGSVVGLCPICVGTSIADQAGCTELSTGPTLEPLLIAPFLAATLEPGSIADGYEISWQGGSCVVTDTSTMVVGTVPERAEGLMITRLVVETSQVTRKTRIELDAVTFAELDRFAHRVYAPATEASRSAGAGAGTTDTD